jgi:hypothetical protein
MVRETNWAPGTTENPQCAVPVNTRQSVRREYCRSWGERRKVPQWAGFGHVEQVTRQALQNIDTQYAVPLRPNSSL